MTSTELEQAFVAWADRIVARAVEAIAYNFNLYEHQDAWAVQLVGTGSFDPANPDWACDETFSSGEDLFVIPKDVAGDSWDAGLAFAKPLISRYLQTGTYASRLNAAAAVGVGFVDGDLEVVHRRRP